MAWAPDADGVNGVYLARDVVHHAGRAMELCMRQVAPRIMSWAQLGEAAVNIARRRALGHMVPEYVPDWTRCVDHFLIHAGGGAGGAARCWPGGQGGWRRVIHGLSTLCLCVGSERGRLLVHDRSAVPAEACLAIGTAYWSCCHSRQHVGGQQRDVLLLLPQAATQCSRASSRASSCPLTP